jgi:hypothetical protein
LPVHREARQREDTYGADEPRMHATLRRCGLGAIVLGLVNRAGATFSRHWPGSDASPRPASVIKRGYPPTHFRDTAKGTGSSRSHNGPDRQQGGRKSFLCGGIDQGTD